MKSSKLKIYLLLALSMMFFILGLSGCNSSEDEVVSHKITLYTTSYTIAEGQSITIDVNKENDDTEVTFSSYNEDVLSVTNEGVVTGIKSGVGYVNVQTEDTSIDCKITVKKMSAIFSLNSEKATMPLGSVYKFQAYFHEGTLNVDDIVWSVTNGENCKFVSEKENSTFTATTKGDFVVTAKYGEYIASCDIKVVSNDAEKLATPVLKINDCKNLQWESVEGVTGYLLSLDGEEWISIDKSVTTYDVSSITDKLLSGESNTFFLLASAVGDYDHIDSDVQELKFLHAYNGVYTSGKEATCQKIGEINYECQTCKKAYTDSNYIEPHSYVDGQCEKCKECRTPELAYEYDDNYASIINGYAHLFVIPVTVEDAERTGSVIEALCAIGSRDVLPAFYEQSLKTKFTRDNESETMIDTIRESLVYDVGYAANGPFADIGYRLANSQSPDFSSYYASLENTALNNLKNFNEAYAGVIE